MFSCKIQHIDFGTITEATIDNERVKLHQHDYLMTNSDVIVFSKMPWLQTVQKSISLSFIPELLK